MTFNLGFFKLIIITLAPSYLPNLSPLTTNLLFYRCPSLLLLRLGPGLLGLLAGLTGLLGWSPYLTGWCAYRRSCWRLTGWCATWWALHHRLARGYRLAGLHGPAGLRCSGLAGCASHWSRRHSGTSRSRARRWSGSHTRWRHPCWRWSLHTWHSARRTDHGCLKFSLKRIQLLIQRLFA
jgi:hypothetical protein